MNLHFVHAHDALFLFFTAFVAGTANSISGGGSFLSFPALLLTGVPPIQANATNTVAIWPGVVASTVGYRREVGAHLRMIPLLTIVGMAGGVAGANILLKTPQATFLRLVPWLLLMGTLLFIYGVRVARWVRARTEHRPRVSAIARAVNVVLLLLISIYIGYFGAGVAILVAAVFALMGLESMHAINGLRTYLVSVSNLVAIATFVAAGAIFWPQALVMVTGTAIGGYGGAYYARKMDPRRIRQVVIVIGFLMSAYFFYRVYGS
ncbi:MAG: sulfite exporter TauE/SafE family protein [Terriglobales bacterium]